MACGRKPSQNLRDNDMVLSCTLVKQALVALKLMFRQGSDSATGPSAPSQLFPRVKTIIESPRDIDVKFRLLKL